MGENGNGNGNGNGELTGLQRAFVDAWFALRFNGVAAAREAGYQGDDNSLAAIASQNLRKLKVKEEIERRWASHGVSAAEVLAVLTKQMRANPTDFISHWGGVDLDKIRESGTGIVEEVRFTKQGVVLKMASQQHAAELIGKVLGMFKDQSTNLNIDLDNLTDEQLERIANGEDPAHVLATSGRCAAQVTSAAST